ncbi:hypothetical protein [Pseudonocardia lacus]|uniref:hypothetical protein n=1 Tax=Pseudonocardia lacus TaxID=2835865 RepID=UPI001BDCC417|nr:hypothetical protein [Pseudonocardia lacus]
MQETAIARLAFALLSSRPTDGLNKRVLRQETGQWTLALLPKPTRKRKTAPPEWVVGYVRTLGGDPALLDGLDAMAEFGDDRTRVAALPVAELTQDIVFASATTAVRILDAIRRTIGLSRGQRKSLEDKAARKVREESIPIAVRDRQGYDALLDEDSSETLAIEDRVLSVVARLGDVVTRPRLEDGVPVPPEQSSARVLRLAEKVFEHVQRALRTLGPRDREIGEDLVTRVTLEASAALHENYGMDADEHTIHRWVVARLRWRIRDVQRQRAQLREVDDGVPLELLPGEADESELTYAVRAVQRLRATECWEGRCAVEIVTAVLPTAHPPQWASRAWTVGACVQSRWETDRGAASSPPGAHCVVVEEAVELVVALVKAAILDDDLDEILSRRMQR